MARGQTSARRCRGHRPYTSRRGRPHEDRDSSSQGRPWIFWTSEIESYRLIASCSTTSTRARVREKLNLLEMARSLKRKMVWKRPTPPYPVMRGEGIITPPSDSQRKISSALSVTRLEDSLLELRQLKPSSLIERRSSTVATCGEADKTLLNVDKWKVDSAAAGVAMVKGDLGGRGVSQ